MKNLKIFLGAIALSAMFFAACEKDHPNPVADNGSATISGTAYVDLTELNDTNVVDYLDYEFVPQGTKLYAKFNTEDLVLVPSSSATYADMYVQTTVGANGAYSFTIPANSKSFEVAITGDDFSSPFTEINTDTITYNSAFTLSETTVSGIYNGAIRIQDLYYGN